MLLSYQEFLDLNLNEKIINIIDPNDSENIDEIWDILIDSYKNIGGFQSATDKEDLKRKVWMFKAAKYNNRIVCVLCYKKEKGRKLIALGTDGSEIGKEKLYQILKDDKELLDRNSWGEVSGKMEHILLNKLEYVPLPNTFTEYLLPNKECILSEDGYHYTRFIKGVPYVKILIGYPNISNLPESTIS